MKTLLLSLTMLLFLATSCSKPPRQAYISGTIANANNNKAYFVKDTLGFGLSTIIDTIAVDKDGKFKYALQSNLNSESLLIVEGDKMVRISVPKHINTDLIVNLDAADPDNYDIMGPQSDYIRYAIDQQKYWVNIEKEMSEKYPVLAKRDTKDPLYFAFQDSITDMRIAYLMDYFKTSKLSTREDFIQEERRNLIFSNLYYRLSGQDNSVVDNLAFYKDSDKPLSYSDKFTFTDPELIHNRNYRRFINSAILTIVRHENPDADLSSYELYLEKGTSVIDRLIESPKVRNAHKLVLIDDLISNAQTFKKNIEVNKFLQVLDSIDRVGNLNDQVAAIKGKISAFRKMFAKFSVGKKAPPFLLQNRSGKSISSDMYKGKTMIVDVWASWCGPCKASMPEWNKLVTKHEENDTYVFLSVSIDENQGKWLNTLDAMDIKGVSLHVGKGGFDSDFAKDFEIKAIPNYIALDQKGNFLAVTTSLEELKGELNL